MYDTKCKELAEAFLADKEMPDEMYRRRKVAQVAQAIQGVIESELLDIEMELGNSDDEA